MKTELYTAFQLSAIRITAAVMLLAAVIGSVLHWVLRSLMKIDPPQIGGATGDKIQQVIGNSNPSSPHFQLQGLDVTGTASQSSGIGLSYVVVTVLGILLVAGNFRHGAVMWKVLRGRGRWGLNMLGTVAVVTATVAASAGVARRLPHHGGGDEHRHGTERGRLGGVDKRHAAGVAAGYHCAHAAGSCFGRGDACNPQRANRRRRHGGRLHYRSHSNHPGNRAGLGLTRIRVAAAAIHGVGGGGQQYRSLRNDGGNAALRRLGGTGHHHRARPGKDLQSVTWLSTGLSPGRSSSWGWCKLH